MLLRSIATRTMNNMPTSSFPLASLLPKKETKADLFLTKYPEYDGRGVKVAVFDTGVDPGAIGLQKTTTGLPKIIDIIDCSGAGDVKLTSIPSSKVLLNSESTIYEIEGLSGRKLQVPAKWVKGEGTWQLGLKRVYELWPKSLVERITEERKKEFMQKHHEYESTTQAALAALEAISKPTDEQKEELKEMKSRINATKTLKEEYADNGPVYDCIVYKPKIETELDKTSSTHLPWAVVDTSESGDLSTLTPMNAYNHTQQFGVFSDASLMSYSFNFYDEDILSISVVAGTHGTHVAGIIAAHHPDQPELNGVAPGAQILSMTIGDGRLGSMETSQSFMRAMNRSIELGVDVINISYGEDSHIANDGPLMNYMRDIVIRKHKIAVVSSAGNNGPGYSTIGAPGGMTSSIISVGAYVSKDMALAQYALRDQAGDSAYTWSSRGPSIDGDKGVTILAPGAAITCVPPYALNQNQLMNGTSMSSPNAAGGVALLISGLRDKTVDFTPASLSRSLIRSSANIDDEFKIGLMDIPATFDDLIEGDGLDADVYFDVVVDNSRRGILMRDAAEFETAKVYNVEVKPCFQKEDTRKKFNFELFLTLESASPWLTFAQYAHLNNTGRALQIKADASKLEPGLHITSVTARSNKTKKVVFEIPVTIAKPLPLDAEQHKHLTFEMKFKPGQIERRYIDIPHGVTGCTITTSSLSVSTPVQLWTHVTQFLPDTRRTWTSTPFVQNFSSSSEAEAAKKVIKLVPGTAEFCFAQFWNSVAEETAAITAQIEFHGIFGDFGKVLQIQGGTGYKQVIVESVLGMEELKPVVRLEMLRKHLRPTTSAITSLGSRDVLEDTVRLYSMIVQYTVKFSRACESKLILPMSGTLYEDPFYSVLVQVFDEKKNRVYFTTTYPEKHKFEKKTYTIVIELVHQDRAILEKMKDQLIAVESALEKELTLDTYDNFLTLYNKSDSKIKPSKLTKGQKKSIVISTNTEMPKEATFGDILVGSIQMNDHKELKQPVLFSVPPAAIAKKEDEPVKFLLELKLDLASKISDAEEKHKFLEDLAKDSPKDLQVLGALLKDSKSDQKEYVANSIIDLIDAEALAKYNGVAHKLPADQTEPEKIEAREMTRQKELLTSAYAAKLEYLAGLADSPERTKSTNDTLEQYNKWIDAKSASSQLSLARSYHANKQFGRSLEQVLQAVKSGDLTAPETVEAQSLRLDNLASLHWTAWHAKDKSDKIGTDPDSFSPF